MIKRTAYNTRKDSPTHSFIHSVNLLCAKPYPGCERDKGKDLILGDRTSEKQKCRNRW